MNRYKNLKDIAESSEEELMTYWEGLGYYRRARFIHQTAQKVVNNKITIEYELPSDLESLMNLPGIGRSTAGAILSLGMGKKYPILDANVKRVLARIYGIKGRFEKNEKELWTLAENLIQDQGKLVI